MKKLFPALCLLLVSATLLGTSTYAWFSMNKEVTANNISITAKSNTIYLLINDTGTANTGDDNLDLNVKGKALFPAALDKDNDTDTDKNPSMPANWYTAAGKSTTDGTLVNETKKYLTAENFENYVVKKTVYLTLAKNSVESGKLTVKGTTFNDNIGGASTVKFAVGDNVVGTITKDDVAGNTAANTVELATGLKDDDVVKVDIYYYFDGNDADITTENFDNNQLTTSNVEFEFAVADKA